MYLSEGALLVVKLPCPRKTNGKSFEILDFRHKTPVTRVDGIKWRGRKCSVAIDVNKNVFLYTQCDNGN